MKPLKKIARPDLKDATILTPMEMNRIHFSEKRTIITPRLLEKIAATANSSSTSSNSRE